MNLHGSLWKQFIFAAMETVDICSWSFLKGQELKWAARGRAGVWVLSTWALPAAGWCQPRAGRAAGLGRAACPSQMNQFRVSTPSFRAQKGSQRRERGGISKPSKSVFPLPVSELKKLCVHEDVDLLVLKTPKPTLHLNKGVSCPKYWLCRQSYGRVDISKIYICVLQGRVCVSSMAVPGILWSSQGHCGRLPLPS